MVASASSEYSSASWSATQATGAPNTFKCGDAGTAWASNSPDSGSEWLELDAVRLTLDSESMSG